MVHSKSYYNTLENYVGGGGGDQDFRAIVEQMRKPQLSLIPSIEIQHHEFFSGNLKNLMI